MKLNLLKIIKEEILKEAKIKVGKDEYDKLFEDKTILVLKPKTHKASCKYGAGSKWCVTMRHTDEYWKNYTKKTSNFGGSNWYNVVGVVEKEVSQSLWDKLKGKKPEKVKEEVREFIEEFPVGILYFVLLKKRITGYNWNEELKYNEPIYEDADPKDPMNKLALLYKPNKADFGDMSWWENNSYGFYDYIGHKLDAAHNNMSIFNALDQKVTLRQINSTLGRQFATAFNFIEEDFQKERNAIYEILKNVLHKLKPLAGGEGSDNPETWMTAQSGELVHAPTKNMQKNKEGGTTMRSASSYKSGHW